MGEIWHTAKYAVLTGLYLAPLSKSTELKYCTVGFTLQYRYSKVREYSTVRDASREKLDPVWFNKTEYNRLRWENI